MKFEECLQQVELESLHDACVLLATPGQHVCLTLPCACRHLKRRMSVFKRSRGGLQLELERQVDSRSSEGTHEGRKEKSNI